MVLSRFKSKEISTMNVLDQIGGNQYVIEGMVQMYFAARKSPG